MVGLPIYSLILSLRSSEMKRSSEFVARLKCLSYLITKEDWTESRVSIAFRLGVQVHAEDADLRG
jgi:hypothetical protein